MTRQRRAEFIVGGRSWLLIDYEMALLSLFLLPWLLPSSSSTVIDPRVLNRYCNGVPYPFGILNDSYAPHKPLKGFELYCNYTASNSLKVKIRDSFVDVTNISLEDGYLSVLVPRAKSFGDCRGQARRVGPTGVKGVESAEGVDGDLLDLTGTPYTFHSRNMFTVLGCDTMARVRDRSGNIISGCVAFCVNYTNKLYDQHDCYGVKCCQAAFPKGIQEATVDLYSIRNLTKSTEWGTQTASECNQAFLIDGDDSPFEGQSSIMRPIVLDWSIGNKTCKDAHPPICGPNADCYEPSGRLGYRCKCKAGFDGNAYLPDPDPVGCQGN